MRAFALGVCALFTLTPCPVIAETTTVNGIILNYTVRGMGEPLLLLHGFGSCATDWGSIAEQLAATHKVIAIDARGHGRSTNPAGRFSHALAAEDARALMDALGIKQARALGFSSGGMTLLHLASRYPDRINKMVVVGATNYFPEQARAILKAATMDSLPPAILDGFRQCASRGEEQVRSLVSQFQALGFSKDDMDLRPGDLAKIKARTLIVHGDRDTFFPVAIPVALYRAIGGSALWIVPNGTHSPTAGATETDFVGHVEAFLAK